MLSSDFPKEASLSFDKKSYSIFHLLQLLQDERIVAAPYFKRGSVWNDVQQSRFIESILLGLPIPTLYFELDSDGTWFPLDGTQRLLALQKFAAGSLILRDLQFLQLWEGMDINELPGRQIIRFEEFVTEVVFIDSAVPKELKAALLERLNLGSSSISSQYIRNYLFRNALSVLRRSTKQVEKNILFSDGMEGGKKDELTLCMLAFYFREKTNFEIEKLEIKALQFLMKCLEKVGKNEEQELEEWFQRQCEKLSSFLGPITVWQRKPSEKVDPKRTHLSADEFLISFGLVISQEENSCNKQKYKETLLSKLSLLKPKEISRQRVFDQVRSIYKELNND